uniref:SH2 domain-containing protein n=1 Tax=Gouania willdenowi TaxID=441366 RepID=A0A8C5HZL7_GOUWI
LSAVSIYYGAIGQEAAEKLLQRFGRDGSFLLRDSRTMEGAFCLCVSYYFSSTTPLSWNSCMTYQ